MGKNKTTSSPADSISEERGGGHRGKGKERVITLAFSETTWGCGGKEAGGKGEHFNSRSHLHSACNQMVRG